MQNSTHTLYATNCSSFESSSYEAENPISFFLARYPSPLLKGSNRWLPNKVPLQVWTFTTASRREQRQLSIKTYRTAVASMYSTQLWHFQLILKDCSKSRSGRVPLSAENTKKLSSFGSYQVIFCLCNPAAKPRGLLRHSPTIKNPSHTQHLYCVCHKA